MTLQYQSEGPYTLPQNLSRNIRYARILLGAYSGRESELTAITQYIYHHNVASRELPDISDCLRRIAVVEMRHLDLLAATINALGLRPSYTFYQGTRRVRWNAGFVQYGRNLRDMLELDIQGEYQAIEMYQNAIHCIPEVQIQHLLKRIIDDEELHIQVLTQLRDAL